jgi:hypothetical protein
MILILRCIFLEARKEDKRERTRKKIKASKKREEKKT